MVTKELIAEYRQSLPEEMPMENKSLWHRYFLKKAALAIGVGGLISIGMQFAVTYALFFIGVIFPSIAALDGGTGWQSEIYSQLTTMVIYILSMFVPYLIVAKMLQLPQEEIVAARAPKKGTFLPMFLMGVGTIPLLQYFAVLMTMLLSAIRMNTPDSVLESAFSAPENIVAIILQMILMCVMAPLFEEFAFRGVILQSLRRYGEGFAIVASAILFGLMHSNTAQIPFAFVMGLVLGYMVVKTNSIWPAVALHAVNNGISTVLGLVEQRVDEKMLTVITVSVWAVFIIIGIIGASLYIFAHSKGRFEKIVPSIQKSGLPHPMRTFMSSPTIIISVIAFALLTFMLTQFMQDILQWLTNYANSIYTY